MPYAAQLLLVETVSAGSSPCLSDTLVLVIKIVLFWCLPRRICYWLSQCPLLLLFLSLGRYWKVKPLVIPLVPFAAHLIMVEPASAVLLFLILGKIMIRVITSLQSRALRGSIALFVPVYVGSSPCISGYIDYSNH